MRRIGENPIARRTGARQADVQAAMLAPRARSPPLRYQAALRARVRAGHCRRYSCSRSARRHPGTLAKAQAAAPRRARPTASRPNTDFVLPNGAALCGQTSTASRRGSASTGSTCSPTPHTYDARSTRQTETSAPSAAARAFQLTPQAGLMRRTARSTAAASAEPPPMPAAMGSRLSMLTPPSVRSGSAAARASRAVSARLSPAMADRRARPW